MTKIFSFIFLYVAYLGFSPNLYAQESNFYKNSIWNIELAVPEGWESTDSLQMIANANEEKQYQKAKMIEDAGIVVTFSKFPLNSKVEFNSNINIAARNIEINPKPKQESQLVEYAKGLLVSIAKQNKESGIEKIKVNEIVGVKTAYQYRLPSDKGSLDIFAVIVILIDNETDNYFIITASCLNKTRNEFEAIFDKTINSFRVLRK